jgi:hypothetical protein
MHDESDRQMGPLAVLVPIEPASDGNGLAMRAATFVSGASAHFSVVVLVVPVSGTQTYRPTTEPQNTTCVIPLRSGRSPATGSDFLSSARWRTLLESTLPFPPGADLAPPTMAAEVVAAAFGAGLGKGTPIHVMRSYLAPLGIAVAEQLGSPWCSLDLDDDDESVAASLGRGARAAAYHRLIGAFGSRFDAVCAAAPLEAGALDERFEMMVTAVRNAVAIPGDAKRNPAEPPELLFVGNLGYPPNVQAAETLATQVVPEMARVLRRPVNAHLVGPQEEPVRHLGMLPGIRVSGWVEDLAPFYERATAVVVPLAHGSGTSIKVLEAFARRVPVVATRVGVRGLGVEDGTHVLLGETPAELGAAAVRLVRDPSLGDRLAHAARGLVEHRYCARVAEAEVGNFLIGAAEHGRRARTPDPGPGGVPGTADSP